MNVVSIKENISDVPEGIILEALLEGMTEYYSTELAVKIKRGQKENALKYKANGALPPFGYRVNSEKEYEIDPLTAPIVLEMFNRYADGQTAVEILADLHNRNVFAGAKHGFKHRSAFYGLLRNRRYIGEYKYGETVIPGGMPAIIPVEIFDKVQERVEKNKHKPASKKASDEYILTTKLFCGSCGAMMVGTGGTSHTGKAHHYYKYGNALHRKSCDKKAVKKEPIEQAVVKMTRDYMLKDDIIDKLADLAIAFYNKENTVIPYLQKQLADVDKRIGNVLNSIEEGISNTSVKKRLDDLEEKKSELEIAIAKESIAKPPLEKENIIFWMSRFKSGNINDLDYRRSVVDIFVNSVFVYDDRLVIGFNWKENTKTIKLSELENAVGNRENMSSYLGQSGRFSADIKTRSIKNEFLCFYLLL